MAIYYVDDGGDNSTGAAWASAYTSFTALDAAVALASDDIVYFGHDHVCQYTHTANQSFVGPSSGVPCILISVTQGSNPPTYQASTTNQIDTSEGAYSMTFDGSFALYGISMKSGADISLASDSNENTVCDTCRFALGANASLTASQAGANVDLNNCVIDLTADATTNRSAAVVIPSSSSAIQASGLTFINAAYRTGVVFGGSVVFDIKVSGCDFSGFTNATACELFTTGNILASHCKTAATWTAMGGTTNTVTDITLVNCGPADQPTSFIHRGRFGDLVSSTSIYRVGGRKVHIIPTSWLITTNSWTNKHAAYKTPWVYGNINTTGSKTFDVYITNDTANFTDAEVWLEVECKNTGSVSTWSKFSDRASDITTTASSQDTDSTSTWVGSGPAYTYKQKLSVTATINTVGMFRARIVAGKTSIAGASNFYIDPLVLISG